MGRKGYKELKKRETSRNIFKCYDKIQIKN